MNCPICEAEAELLPQTIDGVSIRCKSCGDYDVVGSIYDPGTFQALEPERKRRALDSAKRTQGTKARPTITSYSL